MAGLERTRMEEVAEDPEENGSSTYMRMQEQPEYEIYRSPNNDKFGYMLPAHPYETPQPRISQFLTPQSPPSEYETPQPLH